ncbi:MAG: hypothetical protein ACPG4U_06360 [Pseudomonadales bacterium]
MDATRAKDTTVQREQRITRKRLLLVLIWLALGSLLELSYWYFPALPF